MVDESSLVTDPSPWATERWWAARRLRYNIGLLIAGALGFVCYAVVVSRCIALNAPGDWEITFLTIGFQSVAYLIAIGVVNLCYSLGPWCERFVQPANVARYRRLGVKLGFGLSVLLPLAPATITLLYCHMHAGEEKRIILQLNTPEIHHHCISTLFGCVAWIRPL